MRFGSIRSDFGVDTSRSPATMIVPVKGDNLVLLSDAVGSTVKVVSGSGNIKFKEITNRKDLEQEIANVRNAGLVLGTSIVRKVVELLAGLLTSIDTDHTRLFKVTGLLGGVASVEATAKGGGQKLKLDVRVLQKQEYKLDIQFPFALDDAGQKYRLSGMPLAHAKDWIEEINLIFGPQVNIWFQLAGTAEPFLNEKVIVLNSSQWGQLKKLANADAKTMTVFLARNIMTGDKSHALGISLNDKSRVIVLQDRDSEDELVKTLAHEIGHTLGDMKGVAVGHPGGKGELMVSVSRFDGVRISIDLVNALGRQ